MKLKYMVVYENNSVNYDIGHQVKVTAGPQVFEYIVFKIDSVNSILVSHLWM